MLAFSVVDAASAAISLAAAAWRRRQSRGALPLAAMLAAAAIWVGCDAVEVQLDTVEGRRLASQVQYLGVAIAAPLFFHLAIALSRREAWLSPAVLAAVWFVPVVTLGLAWTSAWHGWIWRAIELPVPGRPFALYRYGPWFWVLAAQHYALVAVGAALLVVTARRMARPYRRAVGAIVVAVALVWAGNALHIFKLGPYPGLNWAGVSICASGTLLAWVVLDEGLFDRLPRRGSDLLDLIGDGVVLVDRAGRVILANGAAREALRLEGQPGEVLPAEIGLPPPGERHAREWRGEVYLPRDGRERWLDVRAAVVADRWGEPAGRIIVARDVTVAKRLEAERLIGELRQALATVRALEDLLPVCANCHRVRDEAGGWVTIADYLRTRSAVSFTHGICPSCMAELYGE